MKRISLLLLLLSIIIQPALADPQGSAVLTGKVTDKSNGSPLPGAVVFFPDLKTGTATDVNGNYRIEHLPHGTFLLQVTMQSYATISQRVTLGDTNTVDFQLESTTTELPGVVITGQSSSTDPKRVPTPVSVVTQAQLNQNASTNIIDAIAKQPGVAQLGTGPGISKPVIRGLGYNRVVVVNDGVRQEGQQWGDEHGIEVDEFAVSRVEILKGPASLTYGSDAMAGVVNMMSAPTLPQGTVKGNLAMNYQTNNGLIGYSANVAGNLNGFIWDARYSRKQAHDYSNRYDGGVFDSRFTENNFSGTVGLNKSWGYSHLSFSAYHMLTGIVEGDRDSTTGKFVKQVKLNDSTATTEMVNANDLNSYAMTTPHQDIRHYKITSNSNFIIGNGLLKTTFAFQQNQRQEFADPLQPDQYGLYFLMNTINYDVRYVFPETNGRQFTSGINGMQQDSKNKGTEFLVPAYSLFDIGGFFTAKKSWEKLDVSGGIRFDLRTEHSQDLYLDKNGEQTSTPDSTSVHQFTAFRSQFPGVSGSVGVAYLFTKEMYLKANVSRGFRAPNIAELGSNGVHEGTNRYEIGDPHLKAENSFQFDLAYGIDATHVSAEVDLFTNDIQNFVFIRKLDNAAGTDSLTNGVPTFKFVSGHAQLMGGEATLDIHPHPLDWLHFENSFGFVIAQQKNATDSTKYLPYTPAPVFRSELLGSFLKNGKVVRNLYVKAEAENFFRQDHVYSAYGTETPTPGYLLFNAGFGTDLMHKGNVACSLNFSVNNLTDVAYQSHLSRLKYADENYVTGRTGVYNMGRNFSIKLIVPLYLKKPAA